ncbi:MAG: DEAD/DEAH box helicase, partial [Propionibacteriaceae bacterium]|nr:DEAD/DEAH box helicase [Propionibacteriaceae bacterium]
MLSDDGLRRFSAATADWFRTTLGSPTLAQQQAWEAIAAGDHSLVIAPTGSGKTLAAFLWSLDRLLTRDDRPPVQPALPRAGLVGAVQPTTNRSKPARRRRAAAEPPPCRVLYISPLKALANDVERNLQRPLAGIHQTAAERGETLSPVTVALRSGDTPADQRRHFARWGADILITTPESLFLLLTSAARHQLALIDTVIIDEIHSLAGTKRGSHLALSLERLDAQLARPAQRIGLSATVRPTEVVAEFLASGRPVSVIEPELEKAWDLRIEVPVPDLADLAQAPRPGTKTPPDPTSPGPTSPDLARSGHDPENRLDQADTATTLTAQTSIWPHVTERLVDLIAQHQSTIVFVNSRQIAERLASRINELWESRGYVTFAVEDDDAVESPPVTTVTEPPAVRRQHLPAGFIGASNVAAGSSAAAMAHHGSMSQERRRRVEQALKDGQLRAVVATSSLELGIDMGAVDFVIQVEAPTSVASGLQRIGRAGHQVGAVSTGRFFPKYLGDLVAMTVIVDRMRQGQLEAIWLERNPLDVLAQQIVAMVAIDDWTVDDLLTVVQRAAPFAQLSRRSLHAVLDLLSGRYPSEQFAELRPRLDWNRTTGQLRGRRGAQRLAVINGGTIPDRGLYGVFLDAGDGSGRRVGELDEEMVFESRVGDTITLGSSSWLITAITSDQVQVKPVPGAPGRMPFWKGDGLGRSAELGQAIGQFCRELSEQPAAAAQARLTELGLDPWATDNLLAYLADQRAATEAVPSDLTIVVESFRDELGDWRVVVLSPWGNRVNQPWSLLIAARLHQAYGLDIQAMSTDDGIVLRLPDTTISEDETAATPVWAETGLAEFLLIDPAQVENLVRAELAQSSHFAARFREAAARALLLPRRQPGRRQPLWQLRNRAAQLLQTASHYPDFPIMVEAARECLYDDYNLTALTYVMARLERQIIRLVEVTTDRPSPFARNVLFNYVGLFMYEADRPLAELRAAALMIDPALLADVLGQQPGLALAELLDPAVVAQTEAELQCLTPSRQARNAEDVHDLIRLLGPIATADLIERTQADNREAVAGWLSDLVAADQIRPWLDPSRWVVMTDDDLTVPTLVARYARRHGPFTAEECLAWIGPAADSAASVDTALADLTETHQLIAGELRPGVGLAYCDPLVLTQLRRRSLRRLRAEIQPLPAHTIGRFLPLWHGVGDSRQRGLAGLRRAVEQLAGVAVPASALETFILPARVADYQPSYLDELLASGDVVWAGRGELSGGDGWLTLLPTDLVTAFPAPPPGALADLDRQLLGLFAAGGAFRVPELIRLLGSVDPHGSSPNPPSGPRLAADSDTEPTTSAVVAACWRLAWAGLITSDSWAPLRHRLGNVRPTLRTRPTPTP